MGFAFAKLTALARGRVAAATGRNAPVLRRADAHPDAPSRAPIFASRDFNGLDIFPEPQTRRRTIGPQPASPSPVVADDVPQPTFLRPAAPSGGDEAPAGPVFEHAPAAPELRAPVPTHDLSIPQLTERLERGLAQRGRDPAAPSGGSARVIADMPVAAAVPVRDAVAQDADEALRAALGTLRIMADGTG